MVLAPKTTCLCSDFKLKVVRIKWQSGKLLSEMTHQKTLQQETVNSSSALQLESKRSALDVATHLPQFCIFHTVPVVDFAVFSLVIISVLMLMS